MAKKPTKEATHHTGFRQQTKNSQNILNQRRTVGRELMGALAKLVTLRRTQNILQPPIGLLRLGQCRLDLGEAGFQQGIFMCKISGIHDRK